MYCKGDWLAWCMLGSSTMTVGTLERLKVLQLGSYLSTNWGDASAVQRCTVIKPGRFQESHGSRVYIVSNIGVQCKWQMATVGTATQWMPQHQGVKAAGKSDLTFLSVPFISGLTPSLLFPPPSINPSRKCLTAPTRDALFI